MNSARTFFQPVFLMIAVLLLAGAMGCGGPGKPAVDTYLANLTSASQTQGAADRKILTQLFSEVAGRYGLDAVQPLPTDAVALYFPCSTGLNLSLSVLATGGNGLTISIIPVNLGKRDNAACRAVIAAMDKSLKQTFGSRLKTNP